MSDSSDHPVASYTLSKDLRQAIRDGHPWVFDRALRPSRVQLEPGALVELRVGREVVALAYADPGRPIAARILDTAASPGWAERRARGWRDPDGSSADWVTARALAAARCRMADPRLADSNAWRLIHGENDYLPGLIVDRYADTAVIAFDGPGAAALWAPRWPAILAGLRAAGVDLKYAWARPPASGDRRAGPASARAASFDPGLPEPPESIAIFEGDAHFAVDVRRGHKTGLFLDQRDNRRLVGQMAAGLRVLDICAYAGMFSVHAALGGAAQVTAVDISAPAMAAAERNFERNQLAGDHRFVVADAFEFLADADRSGRRYDLVILDPPSFAPSERARKQALDAYYRLDRLGLAVVEPGGWLMTASCSSHVTGEDSLRILQRAARAAGRRIRVTDIRGAASDHPTLPGFSEGRYLSFIVAAVE